jgi:hypothetical protein
LPEGYKPDQEAQDQKIEEQVGMHTVIMNSPYGHNHNDKMPTTVLLQKPPIKSLAETVAKKVFATSLNLDANHANKEEPTLNSPQSSAGTPQ